mmetsp:Transcript_21873/g.63991  ORF Transcript_21873/g.63991 Transcript_21873/m.63991 type:complete len:341 (+) Transcript_21873:993-2015(+)
MRVGDGGCRLVLSRQRPLHHRPGERRRHGDAGGAQPVGLGAAVGQGPADLGLVCDLGRGVGQQALGRGAHLGLEHRPCLLLCRGGPHEPRALSRPVRRRHDPLVRPRQLPHRLHPLAAAATRSRKGPAGCVPRVDGCGRKARRGGHHREHAAPRDARQARHGPLLHPPQLRAGLRRRRARRRRGGGGRRGQQGPPAHRGRRRGEGAGQAHRRHLLPRLRARQQAAGLGVRQQGDRHLGRGRRHATQLGAAGLPPHPHHLPDLLGRRRPRLGRRRRLDHRVGRPPRRPVQASAEAQAARLHHARGRRVGARVCRRRRRPRLGRPRRVHQDVDRRVEPLYCS